MQRLDRTLTNAKPGKVKHLEENVAAAAIQLSDEDFATLDKIGR